MAILWFCLVAAMLAVYAVLDGFDIGTGIVYLFAARSDTDRRALLRTIGPVWDGNEVWLIASGTSLFFAFPIIYGTSFSGFYLPLMIVLWLLIARGVSIEFRNHVDSPIWTPPWDVAFAGASAALAIFYGAAIGNVVRGVPLSQGSFFLPLWTDFRASGDLGILDWFTILVALASFCAMAEHGALWCAMKVEGELAARCRTVARWIWFPVVIFTALVAIAGPYVQPRLLASLSKRPWGFAFSLLAIVSLIGMHWFNRATTGPRAFIFSSLYVASIAACVAFGLFPYVLPSNLDPNAGLTVYNASAPPESLKIALAWFVPGITLAIVYMFVVYRAFAGKVAVQPADTSQY